MLSLNAPYGAPCFLTSIYHINYYGESYPS